MLLAAFNVDGFREAFEVKVSDRKTVRSVPIREVRDLQGGEEVHVTGVVTSANGLFHSSTFEYGFAIQDKTAGIYIKLGVPLPMPVVPGCQVNVSGVLGTLAKMIVVESDGANLSASCDARKELVSAVSMKTGEIEQSNEGLLVKVRGRVTRETINDK